MSHFARVNSENIVTYVTTVDDSIITDENGVEREELGIKHLKTTIPDSINDRWIQTSYNTFKGRHRFGGTPLRKNFAGIGCIYDEVNDAFIPPKPYESWTLDEETYTWNSPLPQPELTEEQFNEGFCYQWSERDQNWRLIEPL